MNEQTEDQIKEDKQKCCMCPLIARTFVDVSLGNESGTMFNGQKKRLHFCQQDAYTLLRILAKEHKKTFVDTFVDMDTLVYGNEESVLHDILTGKAKQ